MFLLSYVTVFYNICKNDFLNFFFAYDFYRIHSRFSFETLCFGGIFLYGKWCEAQLRICVIVNCKVKLFEKRRLNLTICEKIYLAEYFSYKTILVPCTND